VAVPSETLSFVCSPEVSRSGSAYLRAFQLAELAAKRLKSVRVRKISELAQGVRDEILVFNKSCFRSQAVSLVLEALPAVRRHNVCLADPLDAVLAENTASHFDGLIASSLTQMEHLSARSSKPVFLIHHHVDVRLPSSTKAWDRARVAYFGELANTWHVDSLGDRVDFISIDTKGAVDISWARHLPYYNVHYCLRRARDIDGFKPATKLFVAASLGATVIVESGNEEARRLLPKDYPYFADTVDLSQVRRVIDHAIATFGKEEWVYAKAALGSIHCYRQEPILDAIEDMMQSVTRGKITAAGHEPLRPDVD
jgi:hypothetical protein